MKPKNNILKNPAVVFILRFNLFAIPLYSILLSGLVFWPLRVVLSGKEKSPDPIDIALALGKKETVRRVEKAIDLL